MADAVVVGVDGSHPAEHAVRWAAVDAERMGRELLLVAVVDDRDDEAHGILDSARRVAVETAPTVRIAARAVQGNPSGVLRDISEQPDVAMLVVGCRGRGPMRAAALGSVSSALAAHSWCPVVVVRGDTLRGGPIVVGVDGAAGSRAATAEAFAHAEAADVPLIAVYSYCEMRAEGVHGLGLSTAQHEMVVEQLAAEAHERLTGWLADVRTAHPTVAVEESVAAEGPALRILDAARDAQLIVLGHRGTHSALGTMFGSTVHTVLHTSTCPVMVVRERSSPRPGGMP